METCISCNEEKELNENAVCEECDKEIQTKIDEVVKNADIENNNIPAAAANENILPGTKDNFKDLVEERNKEAEKGKEELDPVPEDEVEDKKSSSFLKYVGFGLLALSAIGIAFNLKKAKEPHNLAKTGELNDR